MRGLTLKIGLLFLALWLAVMAVALPLASLPEEAAGRVLVAFPPGQSPDARLLAIAAAGGRPVLPMLGGRAWLAEAQEPGFVGRLKAAGAWAAFRPATFAVLPGGGCFYISVRKPGPPQPHPPI
ncbi:hypothetical protein [Pelagibius sp. 7325]|uniref:hypothetical protein n=1 Tax=Pelagibius sp. 7325 TaxID=3131994 RepID=UPI0030EBAD7B